MLTQSRFKIRAKVAQLIGEAESTAQSYLLVTVDDLRSEVMRRVNTARVLERFVSLEHRKEDQSFLLFLGAETPPDELERVILALRGGSQAGDQGFPETEIILTPNEALKGAVNAPGYVAMDRTPYHNVVRIPYGVRLQRIRDQLRNMSPVAMSRATAPSPTGGGMGI